MSICLYVYIIYIPSIISVKENTNHPSVNKEEKIKAIKIKQPRKGGEGCGVGQRRERERKEERQEMEMENK